MQRMTRLQRTISLTSEFCRILSFSLIWFLKYTLRNFSFVTFSTAYVSYFAFFRGRYFIDREKGNLHTLTY